MLAITAGEPAGIGLDLVAQLTQQPRDQDWVVITDPDALLARAHLLGLDLTVEDTPDAPTRAAQRVTVHPIRYPHPVVAGQIEVDQSAAVLESLDCAIAGCQSGLYSGMVTGPVQKSAIIEAGHKFSGHTEYLAAASGVGRVVMLLVADRLRVALATTHLPLADVPTAITEQGLVDSLRILHRGLVERFAIAQPRILVAGLNPHAGEGGHLGREELDVIQPACALLREDGFDLLGPLPADTLFTPRYLDEADAVLAMYHDQGLPVLKALGFGRAVNVTLGLPFVRTSVDHGTALDLAGTGHADAGSLQAAIELAAGM